MPTSPDQPRRRGPGAGGAGGLDARAARAPSPVGLRLLAQAVARRPLDVRLEELPDPRAYLAGDTLVGDESLLARDPRQLRAQVVVQAAMLAVGSFEPRIMRALVGRSRSTGRYCALEGVRAVRTLADRVPPSVLRAVLDLDEVPLSATAEESRALAISQPAIMSAPEFFGQVRPLLVLRTGERSRGAAHGRIDDEADSEAQSQGEGEESKVLKALSNPMVGDSALQRFVRSLLGRSSGPSEDANADGSGPSVRTRTTITTQRRRGRPAGNGAVAPAHSPGGGSARYPEWDVHGKRYRQGWVTVFEADPWDSEAAQDAGPLGLDPRPALKRDLLRAALAREARGRAAHGEQLHPDGVVDLAQWLRQYRHGYRHRQPGGVPPLPFVDIRRSRPDVAVMVLLDASGSSQDDTEQGAPVFDRHLALAYRLASACEGIGLPVGLYAFQTWGRGLVRVLRVKAFTERLGARTRTRLGHVRPAGYTRMGGAVRHTTRLLEEAAPGMKRLLVLVSDGFPYDEGYEGAYATADTRQAMWEARKLGIGCVCVGITAPTPEELRSPADALAAASALHVGDVAEIERRLGGLFRRALRDARRRSDHDGVVTVG